MYGTSPRSAQAQRRGLPGTYPPCQGVSKGGRYGILVASTRQLAEGRIVRDSWVGYHGVITSPWAVASTAYKSDRAVTQQQSAYLDCLRWSVRRRNRCCPIPTRP